MATKKWVPIGEPLGAGGQGVVHRVRLEDGEIPPTAKVMTLIRKLTAAIPPPESEQYRLLAELETNFRNVFGGQQIEGAKKQLKNPNQESLSRLELEAKVYESISNPHLLRIFDKNIDEGWIVTEFQPNKTLEERLAIYRGSARAALKAIRPLVAVLAEMHEQGFVHRDFKPGNIFIGRGEQFVLGDAGLAFYLNDTDSRRTSTYENVGTRDYMPAWAYSRRCEIKPTFDVFSVGKVLWALIAGEPACPLWYIHEDDHDLTKKFPSHESMYWVNRLLDKCIVQREQDMQIQDGHELLNEIDSTIDLIWKGCITPERVKQTLRTCKICGVGRYIQVVTQGQPTPTIGELKFMCTECGHEQFFYRDKS